MIMTLKERKKERKKERREICWVRYINRNKKNKNAYGYNNLSEKKTIGKEKEKMYVTNKKGKERKIFLNILFWKNNEKMR